MLTPPVVLMLVIGAAIVFGVIPIPGLGAFAPAGAAPLSPEERERLEIARREEAARIVGAAAPATNTQIARGYQLGGLIGSSLALLPGAFFGAWLGPVGLAVGVGVGYVLSVTGNDTLGARREFAKRLGFASLDGQHNAMIFGVRLPDKPGLFDALNGIGRSDLVNVARNVIGMQDDDANMAWMQDVVIALIDSGYVVTT